MNFTSIKDGILYKCGENKSNWNKRWFILQDNLLYYFLNKKKDQVARGTILLSAVQRVMPIEGKHAGKQNCFFIETKERTWYFSVESPAVRDQWIHAIVSMKTLHQMRDQYKEATWGSLGSYRETIVTTTKKIVFSTSKLIGITKGLTLKNTDKEFTAQVEKENEFVGNVTLQFCHEALEVIKCPFDPAIQRQFYLSCYYIILASRTLGPLASGSANQAALDFGVETLEKECRSILNLVVPSPKTEIESLIAGLQTAETRFLDSNNDKNLTELQKSITGSGRHFMESCKTVAVILKGDKELQNKFMAKATEMPNLTKSLADALQAAFYFKNNEQTKKDLTSSRDRISSTLEQIQELCVEGMRLIESIEIKSSRHEGLINVPGFRLDPTDLRSQYEADKRTFANEMMSNFQTTSNEA